MQIYLKKIETTVFVLAWFMSVVAEVPKLRKEVNHKNTKY